MIFSYSRFNLGTYSESGGGVMGAAMGTGNVANQIIKDK